MLKKPLLLVGISGAGKSTVGRLLAERVDVAFIDLDDWVEKEAGMTVGAVFDKLGQSRFRDLESTVLCQALQSQPPAVIATGGGAMVRSQNRDQAREQGYVIWLEVSPALAASRCQHGIDRPLLRDGDTVETLRALLAERAEGYREASMVIQTEHYAPEDVVAHIVDALEKGGLR